MEQCEDSDGNVLGVYCNDHTVTQSQ